MTLVSRSAVTTGPPTEVLLSSLLRVQVSQLTTPLAHLGVSLHQVLLISVPRPTLGLCGLKQAT